MVGGAGDVGDLDVGQPQRALDRAFDDAAAERFGELEREVGPGAGVDPLVRQPQTSA